SPDVTGRALKTTALPDRLYPGLLGGWTAALLDQHPSGAPPRVELIDGALILPPPQPMSHMLALRLLERELHPPENLVVTRQMTVTLGRRQRPAPSSRSPW